MRAMEFTKEIYVVSLSLKNIRVWLPESENTRVWSSSEFEVKNLELAKVCYL